MTNSDPKVSQNLVKLGLSKMEAISYLALLREGSLTAKEVGQRVEVLPHAVYRLMKSLKQKGLVVDLGGYPRRFQARQPQVALETFLTKKTLKTEKLKEQTIRALLKPLAKLPPTQITLVTGWNEVFSIYNQMSKKAKSEILIISIGEPIPDESVLAIRDALNKGVEIKMIAHKYDKENKDLLFAWKKMGMKVRHYPEWGFHLIVFDGKKSLLAVNNPEETRERTGMMIESEALSKALRDYFYATWRKAKEI